MRRTYFSAGSKADDIGVLTNSGIAIRIEGGGDRRRHAFRAVRHSQRTEETSTSR